MANFTDEQIVAFRQPECAMGIKTGVQFTPEFKLLA